MGQTVQLAGNGVVGGVFFGNFGTYQAASDGTFTVDTRDAPALLAAGATYMSQIGTSYVTKAAPAAATAGTIVASAALSSGALTIAAQPDVMRQVALRIDPGTTAISNGQVTFVYTGNDGVLTTEAISIATPASTLLTQFLSKGAVTVTSGTVNNFTGGASPKIQADINASISVPIAPGATGFAVKRAYVDTASEAVGTISTVTLGTIAPNTAPNATHTYSFDYYYTAAGA